MKQETEEIEKIKTNFENQRKESETQRESNLEEVKKEIENDKILSLLNDEHNNLMKKTEEFLKEGNLNETL